MCSHALSSRILTGVPFGAHGCMCNLQFTDKLFLITIKVTEVLKILKLILLLFEGHSGLVVNFQKSYLCSFYLGNIPFRVMALTLNYLVNHLLVTYLGVPLSSGLPRKQDWLNLSLAISNCLMA